MSSSVQSEFVVQGTSYITNPLRRVLVPRAGQKIVICLLGDQPNQFSICSAARSFGQRQPDFLAVDIRYDTSSRLINLTLFEERQHDAVPLYL
jgi:fatty acid synthase subunit beta